MRKYRVGILATTLLLIIGGVLNYFLSPYWKRFYWLTQEVAKYRPVQRYDELHRERLHLYAT
jgi:hypothetical protein